MKKVMLIMAAALLMMTQCKKENETPNGPAEGTMKMTVTAGPGRTSIDTENGAITWSAGDKLYVSDGTNWLGCLTLEEGAGTANGTFTGNVTGLDDEGDACHFFYLGHDNGMTEPIGTAAANISFAAQDGTLDGAMKYHIGYGNTSVTVTADEATGSVIMNTKIAIAHINFTTDGTSAYTGSLTMGGTGIFNTLSVSPDGSTFTGSGDEGITIGNGGGTTGERYVTLIPTETTDVLNVSFTGDATGSMTFLAGIRENKFYGMKDAIAVTLEASAPVFSVAAGTTVEFAPGNLWADATGATPVFHFEANQWDFHVEDLDDYEGKWSPSHVSHFYWSNTTDWQESGKEPYAEIYSYSTRTTEDVFFTEASDFQVSGETAGTWRTLSTDEWSYLLNTSGASSGARTDVNRFAKAMVNDVVGLLIFPDGYNGTAISGITGIATVNSTCASFPSESIPTETWASMESAGAVFLPAAGERDGTDVYSVGFGGNYWSSTPDRGMENVADYLGFYLDDVCTNCNERSNGNAVRLVR